MSARRLACCWGVVLIAACAGDPPGGGRGMPPPTVGRDAGVPDTVNASCNAAVFCNGDKEATRTCVDGFPSDVERDCQPLGQVCTQTLGCVMCHPHVGKCVGEDAMSCRPDGSGYDLTKTCDAKVGEACDEPSGTCVNLCALAEASASYIGCEYWPTTVLNSQLDHEFAFAAVVANPQTVAADVTISLGAMQVAKEHLAPMQVRAIKLPWIDELKGTLSMETSALVKPGAYHLQSSVPVTVYQFNPLEYKIEQDCASEHRTDVPDDQNADIDGVCYSYSNDASLLLPTHVLTGDYIIVARASMLNRIERTDLNIDVLAESPGYFAVIGAEAKGADVTVQVKAHVVASTDGAISALAPGGKATFHLEQGEVLQIVSGAPDTCSVGTQDFGVDANTGVRLETRTYCVVGADYDLTGSEVHATGKVAVISGHNCSFIPSGRWACDHQEEELFPLQTWGKDYLVSITKPLRDEPNVIRLVSGADGNQIHFEPAVAKDTTLDRGEMFEFEASDDFRVVGSQALLVAQFLVGQDYAGIGSAGMMGLGDPSLSLAIPTEQFRQAYDVLVPDTYESNFINVTAADAAKVLLDGKPINGFRSVPGTGMATARLEVDKGAHKLSSEDYFGIVAYGFGTYTSYMYPGGLDLRAINSVE